VTNQRLPVTVLAVWRNAGHDETRRVAQTYGDDYRLCVQQCFEQARSPQA